jgi:hypothetical protein
VCVRVQEWRQKQRRQRCGVSEKETKAPIGRGKKERGRKERKRKKQR